MSIEAYVLQSIVEWETLCQLIAPPPVRTDKAVGTRGASPHGRSHDVDREPTDDDIQFVMISSLWHF